MSDKLRVPDPVVISGEDAMDRLLEVRCRGPETLADLLRYMYQNKRVDFFDQGRLCFDLKTGIPVDGKFQECPSVASLWSVKKKDGQITALVRLLVVTTQDGRSYTRDGMTQGQNDEVQA